MHHLIAVDTDRSDYAFDRAALLDALTSRFPGAVVDEDTLPGSAVGVRVFLPDDVHRRPEIAWFADGGAVSLAAHDQTLAAEVIALLTRLPHFPSGVVLLTDWADDVVALEPDSSVEHLLELAC